MGNAVGARNYKSFFLFVLFANAPHLVVWAEGARYVLVYILVLAAHDFNRENQCDALCLKDANMRSCMVGG